MVFEKNWANLVDQIFFSIGYFISIFSPLSIIDWIDRQTHKRHCSKSGNALSLVRLKRTLSSAVLLYHTHIAYTYVRTYLLLAMCLTRKRFNVRGKKNIQTFFWQSSSWLQLCSQEIKAQSTRRSFKNEHKFRTFVLTHSIQSPLILFTWYSYKIRLEICYYI